MSMIDVDVTSTGSVPYLNCMISAGRGDALSIRRPGHGAHIVRVALIGEMVGCGGKMDDKGKISVNIGEDKQGD